MAVSPRTTEDLGDKIHLAWKATGLSLSRLYVRYLTAWIGSGRAEQDVASSATVKNWVYAINLPRVDHYEVLAVVINSELERRKQFDLMLPFLLTHPMSGGDGWVASESNREPTDSISAVLAIAS